MMRMWTAAAIVSPILLAQVLAAQESLAIRVNVGLVNVAFTARDAGGKLVADLSKDDIEVLDDGAPQSISFFARSAELPLALGLISDVSGSQSSFLKQHDRDLDAFLKGVLTKTDQAFLVCFGNQVRLVSDFSPTREPLIDSLKDFDGTHRSKKKSPSPYPDLGPPERRFAGTAFYDALYHSTTHLATRRDPEEAEQGRRALIVFSDGEDNSSAHHMIDAIEAAQSADVVIYGIRYTEMNKHGITGRNKYGISVMSRIARDTGGRDFDARETDMKRAFTEIGEELRSSYELAYHASGSTTGSDGTFHKLVIRAKRPGVVIRAKAGYFAREDS
jgi:Ca-activated chloride channel homolog